MTLASTYIYGYVSDIEILFTILALIGFVFSIYNMRDSHFDLVTLKKRGISNGRRKLAWSGFRAEVARAIIQGIYLLLGSLAFFLKEPPPVLHEPAIIQVYRFLITWGLITSSALLLLKSYWNFSLRREILRYGITSNASQEEDFYDPRT